MIVLDIETSGLDSGRNGIWQIGAVEFENPGNQFLQEGRIDDEDLVHPQALKVIEKTEAELRDSHKQTQQQLILNFLEWAGKCKNKLPIGHNVGFDLFFMQNKCIRYGFLDKFAESIGKRSLDLHSIVQFLCFEKDKCFVLKEDGTGGMPLPKILEFCGLEDDRKKVKDNLEVSKEGKPHNALEDAKLTAECFSRLVHGKNLLDEFKEFPIPDYLKK